jgi:integrase
MGVKDGVLKVTARGVEIHTTTAFDKYRHQRLAEGRPVWSAEIAEYAKEAAKWQGDRGKRVEAKTADDRVAAVNLFFRTVYNDCRLRVKTAANVSQKHIQAWVTKMEEADLSAATMQTRLSHLDHFLSVMKKPDMVRPLREYVRDPAHAERQYAATESKAWGVHGVSPEDTIRRAAETDVRFAAMLALSHQFGLWRMEVIQIVPHAADCGSFLDVQRGSKNGRKRVVPIETPEQREALDAAKRLCKTRERLGWPERSLDESVRRYKYLCEKIGITREGLGVTTHGLRHDYVHREVSAIAGVMVPVDARANGVVLSRQDAAAIKDAVPSVMEDVGHSRASVSTACIGARSTAVQDSASKALLVKKRGKRKVAGRIECEQLALDLDSK